MTDPAVHGQRHPIESNMLIVHKLQYFETYSKRMDWANNNVAMTQAESQCPELLKDDFKLMFSRCECFDAKISMISSSAHPPAPSFSSQIPLSFLNFDRKPQSDLPSNERVEMFGGERAFQAIPLGILQGQ